MSKELLSQNDLPPNRDSIGIFLMNMHYFQDNQELFLKEGFTFRRFEKTNRLAQLNTWDLYHLFYCAKRIPTGGTYLEIGSFMGGSLLCAYEATRGSDKHTSVNFIAIEPAVTEQLLRNTEIISHLRFIKSKSDIAKNQIENNSIDLLFIDGDHSYEQCKRDIQNYWPKLKKDGVLLGHDYHKKFGVMQAVNEIFTQERVVLFKNCMSWSVKKRGNLNESLCP